MPVATEWADKIIDYAADISHAAPVFEPTHQAQAVNPLCGDRATVQLNVNGPRVARVGVMVDGCCLSRAAGAMLAEEVEGLPLAYSRMLTDREWLAIVGLEETSPKKACALLPLVALRKAIKEGAVA